MVMGLLDTETGVVYFMNAEHPSTVLYRDETADFIRAFRKNARKFSPSPAASTDALTAKRVPEPRKCSVKTHKSQARRQ